MTARKTTPDSDKLLETIVERVESIDKNVEEILERLNGHFAERDWYSKSWCGNGYNLGPENDDVSD